MFGTSLDTPGRSELLGMESALSFTGCPICTHCWSGGRVYDGYRRFLTPDSRGRRRRLRYQGYWYEYTRECSRLAPTYRDNKFVRTAVAFAKQRKAPYLGHKSTPLLSKWPGFDWRRMNIPDMMHDMKLLLEMVLKIIIGRGIDKGSGGWKSWSKDATHRTESKDRGIFRDIWPDRMGPLPWRLTADQLKILEERMGRTMWPHYMDRLHYQGCSFWMKPSRLWKIHRKIVLFYYILATQLRDQLPRLRVALYLIIWALRRLEGQVYSHEAAMNLNVLPGSRVVDPKVIAQAHCDLILGLCLLEGCLPVSHLNPALHHIVHFAQYTRTHGCLRSLWMMYFERYNKYIKNLVRDPSHPEAHLASSVSHDVSARFMNAAVEDEYDINNDHHHDCVLSVPDRRFAGVSRKELTDLHMLGYAVDRLDVSAFKVAHVMGTHFRAGEWGRFPRCGSVVTYTHTDGFSYYARVLRFLKIDAYDGCGFASVRWFSKPVYPHGVPLVVQVSDDGSTVDNEIIGSSILKITQIEPSRIIVEPCVATQGLFFVMRDSGYDKLGN